jgi:hypothetical protein
MLQQNADARFHVEKIYPTGCKHQRLLVITDYDISDVLTLSDHGKKGSQLAVLQQCNWKAVIKKHNTN